MVVFFLLATPDGAVREAELVATDVVADHEGLVVVLKEDEVLGEDGLDLLLAGWLPGDPADPLRDWGSTLPPGVGGDEDKDTILVDEVAEAVEELAGVGDTAEEVGGKDGIEGAEGGVNVEGITDEEFAGVNVGGGVDGGDTLDGDVALDGALVLELSGGLHLVSGANEGLAEVHTDDLLEVLAHLEDGGTSGAAEVHSTTLTLSGLGAVVLLKELTETDGEIEGLTHVL